MLPPSLRHPSTQIHPKQACFILCGPQCREQRASLQSTIDEIIKEAHELGHEGVLARAHDTERDAAEALGEMEGVEEEAPLAAAKSSHKKGSKSKVRGGLGERGGGEDALHKGGGAGRGSGKGERMHCTKGDAAEALGAMEVVEEGAPLAAAKSCGKKGSRSMAIWCPNHPQVLCALHRRKVTQERHSRWRRSSASSATLTFV